MVCLDVQCLQNIYFFLKVQLKLKLMGHALWVLLNFMPIEISQLSLLEADNISDWHQRERSPPVASTSTTQLHTRDILIQFETGTKANNFFSTSDGC